MTYEFSQLKTKLDEIQTWFAKELKTVRTGRANPSVLDGVKADNYGTPTPLNQMANIGVEDAKTLRVTPFDPSSIKEIERAVTEANLGLGVSADDSGLRIIFPDLTKERREELVRLAKSKLEEAKISVRQIRDEVWSDIQSKEREGEITEDEKYAYKEQMENVIKEFLSSLEEAFKSKEREILSD